MRIVTWNMGYWGHASKHDAAWRWLLNDLAPDIALLQECCPPTWVRPGADLHFERAYPDSQRQQWGTAVVTRGLTSQHTELADVQIWLQALGPEAPTVCSAARLNGWCVARTINLPSLGEVLVLSLHNPAFPIDARLLATVDISEIKLTLNPNVWLLDVLFHFLPSRLPSPLLIGGDFNYSRLLDEPVPRGNVEFFERAASRGLVEIHRRFHPSDMQTFFHSRRRPHQLDHFFSDSAFAARVTKCDVVERSAVEGLSDHSPLLLEVA